MTFVTKHGDAASNPKAPPLDLDDTRIYRIQDTLMLAMDARGWSIRQIAEVVGLPKSTVDWRLKGIPHEVKAYCLEGAKATLCWIPGPVELAAAFASAKEKKRRARDLGVKQSIEARRREAQAKLDALCMAAVQEHGTVIDAARRLRLKTRRVKDAIERRRRQDET